MPDAAEPVSVLGVPIAVGDVGRCADAVVRWAAEVTERPAARYVCATSVHGVVEAWRHREFHRILGNAALVCADGMPLVWVGRMKGRRGMVRASGPDLMLETCGRSAGTGVRHFFYGGAAGVAERLALTLARRFPALLVAGWHAPPFRELGHDELDAVAREINAAAPDIVWVGLGTPRQERWAAAMAGRLRAKVIVTVGAAFDYHTGRLRRAPAVLQRAGLEWAYRLAQQPRHVWRRYLTNNPLFVVLATAELLGWLRIGDAHD
ncbi:MAG: WecB/TagA/CpsF family glycosyltransferase, partial [Gemmatimonadales bacterium]